MDDFQWNRTSESWKSLIPKRNFNTFALSDETEEEHRERLLPRFDIPLEVIQQWLYPLYYDGNSTDNYGWIDYDNIEFIKTDLSFEALSDLNVISKYQLHVDEGARYKAYENIPCTERDREHWSTYSTWRVPPLILDVQSLSGEVIPDYADIHGARQIIEGHSRLGYLYAANNCGVLNKKEHTVYIMKYKKS